MKMRDGKDTEKLLSFAGKKLGMSPQQLKKDIECGNFESLNIPEDKKKKIGEILGDKEALQRILSDPRVKNLLDSITKGGK